MENIPSLLCFFFVTSSFSNKKSTVMENWRHNHCSALSLMIIVEAHIIQWKTALGYSVTCKIDSKCLSFCNLLQINIVQDWLKMLSFVTMTWCKIDSKCFLMALLKESDESKNPTHRIWTFYLQWMFIWKWWRHKEKASNEWNKLHWVKTSKKKAKTHNGDYCSTIITYLKD